jgi:hypothetical protein
MADYSYIVGSICCILIATAFCTCCAVISEYSDILVNIQTVGTDLAIYLVFHVLLSLMLPKGSLF